MYPMQNRHTGLVCRGLHKLRDKFRIKQYKVTQVVLQDGEYVLNEKWWTYLQETKENK